MMPGGGPQKRPVRVLFMHGLESGPSGRKAQHLAHHFETLTPSMEVSPADPRQRRSVSRWALPYLLLAAAVVARQRSVALAAAAAVGLVPLLRWRLRAAVDSCAELQREAIAEFQPDAVVGSSWGGLVALRCMELGHWRGPSVLLAPAVGLVPSWPAPLFLLWPGWDAALPHEAAQQCLVLQGLEDTLVSPEAVQRVCRRNDVRLELASPGDHRLNGALDLVKGKPATGRLSRLVNEQCARCK